MGELYYVNYNPQQTRVVECRNTTQYLSTFYARLSRDNTAFGWGFSNPTRLWAFSTRPFRLDDCDTPDESSGYNKTYGNWKVADLLPSGETYFSKGLILTGGDGAQFCNTFYDDGVTYHFTETDRGPDVVYYDEQDTPRADYFVPGFSTTKHGAGQTFTLRHWNAEDGKTFGSFTVSAADSGDRTVYPVMQIDELGLLRIGAMFNNSYHEWFWSDGELNECFSQATVAGGDLRQCAFAKLRDGTQVMVGLYSEVPRVDVFQYTAQHLAHEHSDEANYVDDRPRQGFEYVHDADGIAALMQSQVRVFVRTNFDKEWHGPYLNKTVYTDWVNDAKVEIASGDWDYSKYDGYLFIGAGNPELLGYDIYYRCEWAQDHCFAHFQPMITGPYIHEVPSGGVEVGWFYSVNFRGSLTLGTQHTVYNGATAYYAPAPDAADADWSQVQNINYTTTIGG